MKEKIYSIPVNDAFQKACECPICSMYKVLENQAIEYTMGPSYMEEDTRALTDADGFCKRHMQMLYDSGNKLGIAWMLKTHFDKIIRDVEAMPEMTASKKGLFSKKQEGEKARISYLKRLQCSCFVCNRIRQVFDRYIDTVFYLWKREEEFRTLFEGCKGLCNEHMALLAEQAEQCLSEKECEMFLRTLERIYLENMKRVRDDLEWFINKFDYRYEKEPWKNAKDAIPRAMVKTNGIILEEK